MVEKTMYVTKWWSTRGILKLRGKLAGSGNRYFHSGLVFVRIGTDAFATEEEALVRVRDAAVKKHASLLAQTVEMADIVTNGAKVVNG